ncbi:hypothetical protein RhiirA5_426943 [Rhizophagus irregularis]|uniref:Uncharacterized protein n=1 Tax=Rhizophagus irregularis TaxID=588596 RepID=A0A2N0P385_9GLOM|nr:hypothetical protein RhiirA5_426943 [Rhizophagus irregularis]
MLETFKVHFIKQNISRNIIDKMKLKSNIKAAQSERERIELLLSKDTLIFQSQRSAFGWASEVQKLQRFVQPFRWASEVQKFQRFVSSAVWMTSEEWKKPSFISLELDSDGLLKNENPKIKIHSGGLLKNENPKIKICSNGLPKNEKGEP